MIIGVTVTEGSNAGHPLGEYLRARRALVSPESIGVQPSSRRRVAGLTRAELAVAAGVSVEYYTRLEQGKDRRPSAQVLSALSAALDLDPSATAFLAELARDSVTVTDAPSVETVPAGVLQLLSVWRSTPAFVVGRFGAVLAASPTVTQLTPACRPGGNMFREIFLAADSRRRYVNWHDFTAVLVASLRSSAGRDLDAPELVELIADLQNASPRFRELWGRHDASPAGGGHTLIDHPTEGRIELQVQNLAISGTELTLVVYHAEPGSPGEAAILRLGR
ncbi:helix-turn-helix domain-containing protein [uncultured Microbacterium sp.]|uniref:helix-turn-helix domain-containing protein n=1 Tax=uncultured Microbacterium sp. TaxID=191216 RepID=UPI0035CA2D75